MDYRPIRFNYNDTAKFVAKGIVLYEKSWLFRPNPLYDALKQKAWNKVLKYGDWVFEVKKEYRVIKDKPLYFEPCENMKTNAKAVKHMIIESYLQCENNNYIEYKGNILFDKLYINDNYVPTAKYDFPFFMLRMNTSKDLSAEMFYARFVSLGNKCSIANLPLLPAAVCIELDDEINDVADIKILNERLPNLKAIIVRFSKHDIYINDYKAIVGLKSFVFGSSNLHDFNDESHYDYVRSDEKIICDNIGIGANYNQFGLLYSPICYKLTKFYTQKRFVATKSA